MMKAKYYVIMLVIGALCFSCSKNQQIGKIIVYDLKTQKQEETILNTDTSINLKPKNNYQFDIYLKDIRYNKNAFLHIQNSADKNKLFTYPLTSLGLNGRYTVAFFAPEIIQPKEYFIFWIGELSDKPDNNVYSIVISDSSTNMITVQAAPAKIIKPTEKPKAEKAIVSTPVKNEPDQENIIEPAATKTGFYISSVLCVNVTKGKTTESMLDNNEYKFKIVVANSKGAVSTLRILKKGVSYLDLELVKGKGYYTTDSPQKFEPGRYTFQAVDDNDIESKPYVAACVDNDVAGPVIGISPSDTAINNFVSGRNYNFRCKISDPSGVSKAEIKFNDGSREQTFPLERNRDNYWQANTIIFDNNAASVKATVNAWDNDNDFTGDELQSTKTFTIKKSSYYTNKIVLTVNKIPAKNITLLIQRQGISKNEIKKTDNNGEFYLSGLNGEKVEFWQDSDSTKIYSVKIKNAQDNLKFELKSEPIKPKLTLNITVLEKNIVKTPFKMKFVAYVIPKSDKIIKFSEDTVDQLENVLKYEAIIDSKQITSVLAGNKAKITINTFFRNKNDSLYQSGNYAWAYHVTIEGNDAISVDGNSERFGMVNFPIEAVNAPEIMLNSEDSGVDDLK